MYEYVIYILLAIVFIVLLNLLYKKFTNISGETTSIFPTSLNSLNIVNAIPSFGSDSDAATSSDNDNIGGSA